MIQKKALIIGIIFMIVLCSCNTSKKITDHHEFPYVIKLEKEIDINSNLSLSLKNNVSDSIIIHNPDLIQIEKSDNGQWTKVRILHCPCNANCIKPPSTMVLGKEQEYTLLWNLMEGWCGKKNKEGIKPTLEKTVEEGLYRVVLVISINGEKQTLYKEFKIVNINK
jgi:hypothetical protein